MTTRSVLLACAVCLFSLSASGCSQAESATQDGEGDEATAQPQAEPREQKGLATPGPSPGSRVVAVTDDETLFYMNFPGAVISVKGDEDGGSVEIHAGDVRISASGDHYTGQVVIDAPGTSVRAGSDFGVSEAQLGLPFYPGAREGSGSRVEKGDFEILSQTLRSRDPLDDVVAFYEDELRGYAVDRSMRFGGEEVEFERDDGDERRDVRIQEGDDAVLIELSYSRKRRS